MLTMKLSVYGHFVGNSYEKKKQCGIVKSEWMGEIFSDFASDVSRFFNSHGTSYLHKSIIILITILFFSNEPHLNTFATFFSQQQFVTNKSVTITGGKSANLNANVLFISLQNRFATWIHFNKMKLRNGKHKMLNTNSFEKKSTENLRQSTLNGHIIFRCELEPTRIVNELNNHISKWSQKRNQNWFP